MKVIGLTGGIGSGKTTVAKIFETMGVPVYYSDDSAKKIYFNGDIKSKVIALLGKEAYINDTQINKNYISSKLFSNTALLKEINAIIHPAVATDFDQWKQKQKTSFVLKESAILFETGIYKNVDKTILVVAPEQLRIERICKRDGLSKEEVQRRFKNQWNDTEKTKLATWLIHNDEVQSLIGQCLILKEKIEKA